MSWRVHSNSIVAEKSQKQIQYISVLLLPFQFSFELITCCLLSSIGNSQNISNWCIQNQLPTHLVDHWSSWKWCVCSRDFLRILWFCKTAQRVTILMYQAMFCGIISLKAVVVFSVLANTKVFYLTCLLWRSEECENYLTCTFTLESLGSRGAKLPPKQGLKFHTITSAV